MPPLPKLPTLNPHSHLLTFSHLEFLCGLCGLGVSNPRESASRNRGGTRERVSTPTGVGAANAGQN